MSVIEYLKVDLTYI